GNRMQVERRGQSDDRAGQGRVGLVLRHLRDEGAIDLEDVDRKTLEIREVRVAGAEVVDRDAHAQAFELTETLADHDAIRHDDAFRDLENEMVRRKRGGLQDLLYVR